MSFHRAHWKSLLAYTFLWHVPGYSWENASWQETKVSQGEMLTITQNGQSCGSVLATGHWSCFVYYYRHCLKTPALELLVKYDPYHTDLEKVHRSGLYRIWSSKEIMKMLLAFTQHHFMLINPTQCCMLQLLLLITSYLWHLTIHCESL